MASEDRIDRRMVIKKMAFVVVHDTMCLDDYPQIQYSSLISIFDAAIWTLNHADVPPHL